MGIQDGSAGYTVGCGVEGDGGKGVMAVAG
jgi:hypothetical protein